MRQLSFNDRLAPQRAVAGNRPIWFPLTRNHWLRLFRRRARLLAMLAASTAVLSASSWWLAQPGNAAGLGVSAQQIFMSTTAGIGMTVENVY
ncbi:MAG: hypothetical protein VCB06_05015, partial [Alphaproteobacteria bacterium]